MRILLVNKYCYAKGGSERVFFDTAALLTEKGHRVSLFAMRHPLNQPTEFGKYFVSQRDFESERGGDAVRNAFNILYSFEARRKIGLLLRREQPHIAHLHNIYHQISPSILHSLRKRGIPVVMTLHDFKLVCASHALFHEGKPCEACAGKKYYQCFLKKCVKNSRAKSLLASVEMYLHHSLLHIYKLVDVFISPSLFLRAKLEEMGFAGRIVHVPNFVAREETNSNPDGEDEAVVYFGRLAEEKGLLTLLDAMRGMDGLSLRIVGDGPMREILRQKIDQERIKNVCLVGYKSGQELAAEVRKAKCVIFPSVVFENNPLAIIESFAFGKPVIGSARGGIPELVRENETGLLFAPGDSRDLAAKIRQLVSQPDAIRRFGVRAREFARQEMSAERHYQRLMEVYDEAKAKHRA